MRFAALILAPWLATAVAMSANAVPATPNLADREASNIVLAAGGCGRGFHRNNRGFCVRDRYYRPAYRYGYVAPYYYRPPYRPHYRSYPYYGYYPPYRYW
jgi:hypothetical protein